MVQVFSTSKRSRSPSLGQRSACGAWAPAGGIPHTFEVHTYTRPTVCRHCKRLLRGLFKQGMQCRDCHYNAHRKCLPHVPKDCGVETRDPHGDYQDSSTGSELSESVRLGDGESDESGEQGAEPEPEVELRRRPAPDADSDAEPQREAGRATSRPSSSSSSPSANIPLMRIVQSVKHTKKREGQWLKEGWLVHFTNKDKTIKRHYWRLDSKAITLFQSEQGGKYYKEIPLNEILAIDTARQPHRDVMHCFELRTANVDYMVGVDPLTPVSGTGAGAGSSAPLPLPNSGVGAYLARSWETAIRHALLPVTHAQPSTSSSSSPPGADADAGALPEDRVTDMSQLYQIFPDEVLGSGQFGIVYGGKHRRTDRAVAIKVGLVPLAAVRVRRGVTLFVSFHR
ncbi:hypothetical protein EVAR_83831_1 [Eumeta japonica]|uniref:Uncharacterized protein n=1 Tax=Eumeta variegata TaxID=151549 RepID=A0A4C1WFG2_EUMVA|nr:hypothetical protein EVAR_83831_1 [Eumeta japonica]